MTIRHLDLIVAFLLLAFGCYLVWTGLDFGFMRGTTPGPGFFPVLIGGLIAVLSAANLLRATAGIEHIKVDMTRLDVAKFAGVVIAMVAFVMLIEPLGITIACMLLMASIALVIRPSAEPAFLLRLCAICVLVPIGCRYLFGDLLAVPLPLGPFGL